MLQSFSPASFGDWLAQLQANGYRLTETRRVVVRIMSTSQRVLSPMQIYQEAIARHPGLGLVTVYRTLEKLEELGLIQRVHQPSSCQAFVASADGHMHLLVCQNCGKYEYFSGDNLDGLMHNVGSESGFIIRDHWLQLFGFCEQCSSASQD